VVLFIYTEQLGMWLKVETICTSHSILVGSLSWCMCFWPYCWQVIIFCISCIKNTI